MALCMTDMDCVEEGIRKEKGLHVNDGSTKKMGKRTNRVCVTVLHVTKIIYTKYIFCFE